MSSSFFWQQHRVTNVGQLKKSLLFQYPQIEMRIGAAPAEKKRMVITTWPIMMIISNFEKKESNVGNW